MNLNDLIARVIIICREKVIKVLMRHSCCNPEYSDKKMETELMFLGYVVLMDITYKIHVSPNLAGSSGRPVDLGFMTSLT